MDYPRLVTAGIALGVLGVSLPLAAWALSRQNKKVSVGPVVLAAALLLAALYGFGWLIDGLANALSSQTHPPHYSFLEDLFLGRLAGLRPLLPLRAHPMLAAPVHVGIALGLLLGSLSLVWWFGDCASLTPDSYAPAWQRFFWTAGYGDWRQLEARTTLWLRPLVAMALLLCAGAFFELFRPVGDTPLRPFLWAVCASLATALLINLVASRAPIIKPSEEQAEAPTPPEPEPPTAWLDALTARGFSVVGEASLETAALAAVPGEAKALVDSDLSRELLAVLCDGGMLWAHQAEAAERLLERREHVLLLAPPRAGKSTIARLLAAHVALTRGENALFVLRDAEAAAAAAAGLRKRLARTSWSQNLRCTEVGPELVELLAQRRAPVLTFAHPDALESLLVGHRDHGYLLAHLGLLVVEDLERCSGVRAANLRLLLARLSAVFEHHACSPRLLATLDLAARDYERYAETILGVDVNVAAANGAPAASVVVHAATPPSDPPLPPAALALAEATRLELPLTRVGFPELTRAELERAAALVTRSRGEPSTVPPEQARVSLAELSADGLAWTFALHARLGAQIDAPHLQVLIPRADAVSRWLAEDLRRTEPLIARGRALVADADVPLLRRRHLRAALVELPLAEPTARRLYGEAALAELEANGELSRREENILAEREPPRLERRTFLSPRGAATPPPSPGADVVGEHPLRVIDRATGALLRTLDPERAPLVAYPGAVLLRGGRRFTIPLTPAPNYLPDGEIAAELCEDDLRTQRIRSVHCTVLEPRRLRPLGLGGLELRGGLVAVRLKEEIVGLRRHRRDGSLIGAENFEPIDVELTTMARVLAMPVEASLPALRALAYLLRDCLPAILDCGEEALQVVYGPRIELRRPADADDAQTATTKLPSGPVLLCVDTYPGGAGYARAADWPVLREALGLALSLLETQKCCEQGCERCVRSVRSYQRDPRAIELDRDGARRLARQLLFTT